MAESEKDKAGRLQKRREKEQAKREKMSDTPEAAAERHKRGEDVAGTLKKGVGRGVIFS